VLGGTDEPPTGQPPNRGVIEYKRPKDDVIAIGDTGQISDYWNRYNQVLVTNYREFLLVGRDEHGNPVTHEYHRLAAAEKEFWSANVATMVSVHGHRTARARVSYRISCRVVCTRPASRQQVSKNPSFLPLSSSVLLNSNQSEGWRKRLFTAANRACTRRICHNV
jgi:hypothetical protein